MEYITTIALILVREDNCYFLLLDVSRWNRDRINFELTWEEKEGIFENVST